jgi:hypothetical protein
MPERKGSGVVVRPGTLLIREVLGPRGEVAKLTLIVKGPPGYNPDLADFWFGVTDPDGTPVVDNGVKQLGKLTECYSCHLARATDGYLFGVPLDDRRGVVHGDAGVAGPPDGGVATTTGQDAGSTSTSVCGDFICGQTESCGSCPSDCHCCDKGNGHGQTKPCD